MSKICAEHKKTYLVPIIDVITRWNSTFDMLERAYKYKEIIDETFYRHRETKFINLLLDDNDWKAVKDLIEVLRSLKEATLLASKDGSTGNSNLPCNDGVA